MTDERYVFNQDVAERSKMKTGAFHKKNGSKSKKCTLPSDHLTPAQKRKLSGPCFSINMNEPLHDWKKFRSLPKTMQVNYINGLVSNYGARQRDIADMFGVKPGTFSQYCCAKFKSETLFKKGGTGKMMDERFLDFLTKPESKEDEVTEVQLVESTPKKTDEEILRERFGIEPKKEEPEVKKTEEKPEEKLVESAWLKEALTEPVKTEIEGCGVLYDAPPAKEGKPACMFSAMTNVQMKLEGSREEILNAFNALLGDGIEYRLSFDLSAFAKRAS